MDYYTNVAVSGKSILLRGVEGGKRVNRKVEYHPTFFIRSNEPTEYKTLQGEYVQAIQPGTIPECRDFMQRYKDVDSFPIYGNSRYQYAFIAEAFPNEINWDINNIKIAYIDIEVESENGFPEPRTAYERITAITLKIGDEIRIFGSGDYTPHMENVVYRHYDEEIQLLEAFIDYWCLHNPDVITGWNVRFFDVPYIVNRITNLLGDKEAKRLSPWGRVDEREVEVMNRKQQAYAISGISILDYMELYKKYSNTPQESYRLDHIAFMEVGERKVDYSEYNNLHQLYKYNYQKYIEYNVRDVLLVEKLNDKGRLIDLALTLAYDNKVNYDDVFMQVRMWDAIIYNYLNDLKIVIPQMDEDSRKDTAYEGAYVKEPLVGMHKWVVSFDLNSLYPHLIMQYNISMETLVQPREYKDSLRKFVSSPMISVDTLLTKSVDTSFLQDQNVCMTANRQFFTRNVHGVLPQIMDTMYKDRARYKKMAIDAKKKMQTVLDDKNQVTYLEKEISRYNNLQMAKKVTLNSAYGAMGNAYFRFFDLRIAEAITYSGQLSIRWIMTKLNSYLNNLMKTDIDYVIASDTDSIYLNLAPLVDKVFKDTSDKKKVIAFMDKVCEEKLQPFIDKSYHELAEYMNAYEQKMLMKRESLADRAIWTAKKRYILNVYDEEGVAYAKPKIKIAGLEAVRSSTPTYCRNKIKEAIAIVMEKDQSAMIDFIEKTRKEFYVLPAHEIAFPRSVNNIADYMDSVSLYKKGTPIQVKGSIVYNNELVKKGLTKTYESIKSGEKILFVYLKTPNKFAVNVLSFMNSIPVEFDIESSIDRETQFQKAFVEPMKSILDVINWKTEYKNTLED